MSITINLGDVARDRISGYEGVAIGRTQWLHGCMRITLQAQGLHDGKPIESASFDEPQLELVKRGSYAPEVRQAQKTGGPRPEPTRRREVRR